MNILMLILDLTLGKSIQSMNKSCNKAVLLTNAPTRRGVCGIMVISVGSKFCSRNNFKSLFSAGIVLAVGVSNLYISSNEKDWCHSAWGGDPGYIKGRANHSHPLFASSLATRRTDQPKREGTFSLHHWLFFTDSLSHISSRTDHLFPLSPQSNPLSIMRRAHLIYGPLVFGKSFFHHSSFLLNQRILGETNWIFSTFALTSAF